MSEIPLIAVVGPTASGKTKLGVEIAKKYNGEVVSADSMQIYKGMPIASAAPTKEEMHGIPHHLIGFLPMERSFSVYDYVNLANKEINDIVSRNKQPILVGGTGLYVNSVTNGINFMSSGANEELRQKLCDEMDKIGAENMLLKLRQIDKETADRLHPNDRHRIIRAFEIYMTSGISKTQQDINSRKDKPAYNTLFIGLNFKDRQKLYDRINMRVDRMLEDGLLKEAESTLNLSEKSGAIQAIGHKELHTYLRGEKDYDTAVEDLKRGTRRYAKRQLTWFKKNDNINWIYLDETENPLSQAEQIIERYRHKNG